MFNDGDLFFEGFKIFHDIEKKQFQMQGDVGESELNLYLAELDLPGYYKIISNVLLPIGKNKTQIDTILIHEKGIFCIEYKNLSGWIFGSENQKQWTQCFRGGDKYYFYNPVRQNQTHCAALAKVLRTVPKNIESIIVFSENCELKKINCPNIAVLQLDDLYNYLLYFFGEKANRFTEKNIDAVYKLLKMYIPSREEQIEHIERVRKYTEGIECPKCGSTLKPNHRILQNGKKRYFMGCTNSECGFERDITYAELIKYGNDEERQWAYEKLWEDI